MLHFISLVIFATWYASMGTQATAVIVLVRRGLALTYRLLWLMLLLDLASSLWLVWMLQIGDKAGYQNAWMKIQILDIVLRGLVVCEAFFLQARHFRRIRGCAATLAVAVSMIALGFSLATAGMGVAPWKVPYQPVLLATRYCSSALLSVLILSAIFFRFFGGAMRANVERHVLILGLLLSGDVIVFTLQCATGPGNFAVMAIAQLLSVAIPLVSYVLWSSMLTGEGEAFEAPPPVPRQELERLLQEDRERARHGWI